jgi:hypothetical protein
MCEPVVRFQHSDGFVSEAFEATLTRIVRSIHTETLRFAGESWRQEFFIEAGKVARRLQLEILLKFMNYRREMKTTCHAWRQE